MQKYVLTVIINMALKVLESEDIKKWADAGLDLLEEKIETSANKYDDMFLPMIAILRKSFDIPDND